MKIKDGVLVSVSTFLVMIGAYLAIQIGPVPVVLTNFFIIRILNVSNFEKTNTKVL